MEDAHPNALCLLILSYFNLDIKYTHIVLFCFVYLFFFIAISYCVDNIFCSSFVFQFSLIVARVIILFY